jgi:hypothetical protein
VIRKLARSEHELLVDITSADTSNTADMAEIQEEGDRVIDLCQSAGARVTAPDFET